MKPKTLLLTLTLFLLVFNCSNNIEYSEEFKKETAGGYLYNLDDMIEVYYENNKLMLNWRGGKIEPVAISENEFFVADIYKKFRFVQHPKTKDRYMSIISEDDNGTVTYDYLKAPKGYKTPSLHLEEGNYDKALAGYLEIKKKDSMSIFIKEWDFNSLGYQNIRKHEYKKAIEILKINAALHPNSANVYDSLGEAYLLHGDSLQAYINYKKTLEINSENRRAKKFVIEYETTSSN
ncbi:tetratricopeptide repeat protein [Winogradskyella litoriviva]|uniref:Tetratricopeptide repeat protein n=1 Tax=Winogradskyella litoriviva TaxID=1220182 RepID=A0ABX2E2X7_9FLAO|nr:tetratricopeptide repeat protein [Winogradskyella litoriviva]NRD22801.1 tetratricopeptide repeat protein [Winogradskyella litoriviva]